MISLNRKTTYYKYINFCLRTDLQVEYNTNVKYSIKISKILIKYFDKSIWKINTNNLNFSCWFYIIVFN